MKNLCWIRRDLRLHDHSALSSALEFGATTVVFVFDQHILDKLKDKADRRVSFIYESLIEIENNLQKRGSSLEICYGKPEEEIPKLAQRLKVNCVFCNRDYEPYAKARDQKVAKKLKTVGIDFKQFKDSVFFEKHEVLTGSKSIYKVFTPYKNKWLEIFEQNHKFVPEYKCNLKNLRKWKNEKNILDYDWYKIIGFTPNPPILSGGTKKAELRLKKFENVISDYKEARNFPSLPGTSNLSVYLRFGNLSVRDLVRAAMNHQGEGARTWLSEIIWRDFYQMLLDVYPRLTHSAFKPEYDKIKYPGGAKEFKAWREGKTGYPLVDAAMRCLNATGMMHNRLRMVTASFLCKILLVDWKKGEDYFAEKLLDFDLAANNGGWQWSSSSGADAQPYFRIFNPYTQSEKFDAEGNFIKQWVPELNHLSAKNIHQPDSVKGYPAPIVSYQINRLQCIKIYSSAIK